MRLLEDAVDEGMSMRAAAEVFWGEEGGGGTATRRGPGVCGGWLPGG